MAEEVFIPNLGDSIKSCLLLEWVKKEGDFVKSGEIICEVETDKAAVEVESAVTGTVLKVNYNEGDQIPVDLPIAVIGDLDVKLPE